MDSEILNLMSSLDLGSSADRDPSIGLSQSRDDPKTELNKPEVEVERGEPLTPVQAQKNQDSYPNNTRQKKGSHKTQHGWQETGGYPPQDHAMPPSNPKQRSRRGQKKWNKTKTKSPANQANPGSPGTVDLSQSRQDLKTEFSQPEVESQKVEPGESLTPRGPRNQDSHPNTGQKKGSNKTLHDLPDTRGHLPQDHVGGEDPIPPSSSKQRPRYRQKKWDKTKTQSPANQANPGSSANQGIDLSRSRHQRAIADLKMGSSKPEVAQQAERGEPLIPKGPRKQGSHPNSTLKQGSHKTDHDWQKIRDHLRQIYGGEDSVLAIPPSNSKQRPRHRQKKSNKTKTQPLANQASEQLQEPSADDLLYVVKAANPFEEIIGVFTRLADAKEVAVSYVTKFYGTSASQIVDNVVSSFEPLGRAAEATVRNWPNGTCEICVDMGRWVKVLPKEFSAQSAFSGMAYLALDRSAGKQLFVVGTYGSKEEAWEACKKYWTQLSYWTQFRPHEWCDGKGMFHAEGMIGDVHHYWFVEPCVVDSLIS